MSPILVVLEGPDGSGKTRHVRALTTALTRAQIHAEWFNHQPTALNVCAAPDPWSAALHYATERDRLRRRIERGSAADVVVCDRWWHSTVVFSDLLRDDRTADCFEEALALDSLVMGEEHMWRWRGRGASITTVVLTAPDDVLDARLAARGTPTTDRDRALRRAYESCVYTSDCERFDTSGPPEAVTAQLVEFVRGVLPRLPPESAR
jgi:thymidylate kinase